MDSCTERLSGEMENPNNRQGAEDKQDAGIPDPG